MKKILSFSLCFLILLIPFSAFAESYNKSNFETFDSMPITVKQLADRVIPSDVDISTSIDNYAFFIVMNSQTHDYACISNRGYGFTTLANDFDVTITSSVNDALRIKKNFTSNFDLELSNGEAVPGNSITIGRGQQYDLFVYFGGRIGQASGNFLNVVNSYYSTVFGGLVTAWATPNDLSPVLNELLNGLPVLIPVLIIFISIRKSIRFLFGTLRSC